MSENILEVVLHEATRERYLNYALSVITSRALPDVRDGLKPVQRRILYGMFHGLRLTPDSKHRKSAAVVGEVMAKYHPHGDQSIYDAMVRMAQDFSLRYPLVDGQGNFGSLDGDGAAAMRYTEAKLQHIATELLSELPKQTVDYRQNYDGTQFEPVVLPAQVPNLLINGATGIAVGMATNIPPHSLKEVVSALIALIDDSELPLEKIVGKYIKGPDFPTGGEILNSRASFLELYSTGRGAVDMRARYVLEKEGRKSYIIVNSVPYAVNKAQLISDIADHIRQNKIPQVVDIRDESTEEIRVVMELKRGANPEAAMAYLYKKTNLQTRFNVNLTALCPEKKTGVCKPLRMNLRDVLTEFLDFREKVTRRRLQYDLDQLERRIHILEAFEIIFAALDEAIALIRASDGKSDAREKLMARFELDHDQAEAILEIKLYRLAKLEIDAIQLELNEKRDQAKAILKVLKSKTEMWALIRNELTELKDAYGDRRRSKIVGPQEEVSFSEEIYITKEDSYVIVTREGWIKRQKSYSDLSAVRVREGDEVGWVVPASSRETVVLFTDLGRAYTIRSVEIPSTTGYGEAIQTKFDFADGEHVVGVVSNDPRVLPEISEEALSELDPDTPKPPYVIGVSRGGKTARLSLSIFKEPSTVNGRMFMRLDKAVKNDLVVGVYLSRGHENVSLATRKGRCLLFAANDSKVLSGAGKGVLAIKLSKGDYVVGYKLCVDRMDGLTVETNRGRTEVIRSNKFSVAKRGGKGRELIRMGHIAKVHLSPLEQDFPKSDDDLELTEPDDEPFTLDETPEVILSATEPADTEPAATEKAATKKTNTKKAATKKTTTKKTTTKKTATEATADDSDFAATVPEMPALNIPEEVIDEKVPPAKAKKTDPEDDGSQGDLF